MSTELIINASLPETRIALMENGEIQDLLIERASGKGITGNIYKGRVTRVLPGMQAAFVDIGLEKAAFLYVDDVYVHNEIFEEDEESTVSESAKALAEVTGGEGPGEAQAEGAGEGAPETEEDAVHEFAGDEGHGPGIHEHDEHDEGHEQLSADQSLIDHEGRPEDFSDDDEEEDEELEDEEDPDGDDDEGPVEMGPEDSNDSSNDSGGEGGGGNDDDSANRSESAQSHPGTIAPNEGGRSEGQSSESGEGGEGQELAGGEGAGPRAEGEGPGRRRHRRGRRGGRFRSRTRRDGQDQGPGQGQQERSQGGGEERSADYPTQFVDQVSETGASGSDRAGLSAESGFGGDSGNVTEGGERRPTVDRHAFRSQRSKDRRVPSRSARRSSRAQVGIQDLLKEGQEVIVQVAKDPIATKGARLTCHISLPGRHLVCMPTIDHVGVSRRIERDEERRRLRDLVERNRPRNLGFIVRTASGRGQAEKRIQQDIDYLTNLWNEIREKATQVTAPALVYEDLNSVLRAIRDWVTEDIDKIIVDSRYHYNDILRFVENFMPSLKQKVELYHGDIPIFDAYNISTELSRALERKVWLKSGGYIVIDQAEALVAIDVNTGRFVGKKNLEDTILKTNLEAVVEIAYQLRLRNCGGIIILDLIDMEKEENKQRVYRALEEALKRDRARPSILKISELGLVEMTRKRTRDTIVRALCESCSHCEGKGFIKSKATVAYECLREIEREVIERDVSKILVQAHPDVIDILAIDERETLDQIERRYRKQVYLQSVTDFHPEQFEVAGDKKPGKQAGEFSEVVQSLRGVSAHERDHREHRDRGERGERGDRDRGGGDRGDRGRRGRRGRGRDRDRGRDRNDRGERGDQQPRQFGPGTVNSDEGERYEGGQPPGEQPRIIVRPQGLPQALPQGLPQGSQHGSPQGSDDQQQDFQSETGNRGDDSSAEFGSQGEPGNGPNDEGGSGPGPSGGPSRGPSRGDDDFFENEEDRLAFLRAQAAQDAALARLSSGQGPGHQRTGGGRGGHSGGAGQGSGGRGGERGGRGGTGGGGGAGGGAQGRGRRGRRGGGKFRSGGRDQRDFGPRGGGRGGQGGGGGSTSGGGEGGGGGGGAPSGDSGGGGGDHSTPPA